MRKIALALMPVVMFAQYSPALTLASNFNTNRLYANELGSVQPFELSTQIAEISARIAQTAVVPTSFSFTSTLSDISTMSSLAAQLTRIVSSPAETRLVTNLTGNINMLTNQMHSMSAENYDLRRIATISTNIAQFAAQVAQSATLQNSTLNPSRAILAATNARNAINRGFYDRTTNLTLPTNQRLAVQKVVAETIRNNPQLIVDTIARYSMNNSVANAQALVRAKSNEIFAENNQLVLGNPNADVTIVEFNDYNCTYCKQMSYVLNQATQADSNLKILVKEAPVFQANSELAAKAAVAAKRQGMYENFRNTLANFTGPINNASIMQIARTIGLDLNTFQADLQNPAIDHYLAKNVELARTLGFTITPTIIISKNNGQFSRVITGALSLPELRTAIAAVRSGATTI